MAKPERSGRPGKSVRKTVPPRPAPNAAEKKLNRQQKLFLDELAQDPRANQTQAAIRAGYSEKSARQIASELMAMPHVAKAWEDIQGRRLGKYGDSPERIIQSLAIIAWADRRTVASWGPTGITLHESDGLWPDEAMVVQAVSSQPSEWGFTQKVKFESRIDALRLLGKHHKLFVDKVEHGFDFTGAKGEMVKVLQLLADRLDAGEKLRAELEAM